ncbi:MAG: MopE-related protein [Polyangiales bacterium]
MSIRPRLVPLLFACATAVACAANDSGTAVPGKPSPDAAPNDVAAPDGATGDLAPTSDTPLVMVRDATAGSDGGAPDDAPNAPDGADPGDAGDGVDGGAPADSGSLTDGGPVGDVPARMCAERETCGNGLDDNCEGRVDEGCACLPGQTQPCYDGPAERAGRGVCAYGTQRCEGVGEFGTWSACAGSGQPRPVVCGMGMDFNCNGRIDEGCACTPGTTRRCYSGRMGTEGVGACRGGTQTCRMVGAGSEWGTCDGEALPAPRDTCDGVDRDCDGNPYTGCACMIGQTRACYTGPAGTLAVGSCRGGTQTCVAADGGVGAAWGECTGQTLPATDRCDGVDRNCDGNPNTGCGCMMGATRACYTGPAGTSGVGACRAGTQTCVAAAGGTDWGACTGQVIPTADRCDGVDRNCDGNPNTGCACTIGMTRVCYTGPAGTQGVGICRAGFQACAASGTTSAWGPCMDQITPLVDRCDSVDRNCDGNLNTGCVCTLGASRACYSGPAGTQGVGRCRAGTQGCVAGAGGAGSAWGACGGETLPAALETCGNGVDDNCNGMVDEGCARVCPDGYDLLNDPANCGACGRACASTEACANGVCVGNGQLRVTLTWSRAGDMDLHVVPPCGTEIYYARLSACGGTLDHDDIPGTGPENIFWAGTPASGTYVVCATPYGISGATTFTLTVNRGTTVTQRWTGTRSAASGYVACSRTSPYFVGTFNYP